MPRGRNTDDRLANLERRLEVLKAREASLPEHREYTDEEIVEIGLILLAYVREGDEEKFAGYLVNDHGLAFEKAQEISGMFERILEERRAVAPDPRHPV